MCPSPSVPGIPTNPSISYTTETSTTLSWDPPSSDDCLDHYQVKKGKAQWGTVVVLAVPSLSPHPLVLVCFVGYTKDWEHFELLKRIESWDYQYNYIYHYYHPYHLHNQVCYMMVGTTDSTCVPSPTTNITLLGLEACTLYHISVTSVSTFGAESAELKFDTNTDEAGEWGRKWGCEFCC